MRSLPSICLGRRAPRVRPAQARPPPGSQRFDPAPGTRGPGSAAPAERPGAFGQVRSASTSAPGLLSPFAALVPARAPFPKPLGPAAPRRTAASAHPGLAPFGLNLFLKSRKCISPNGRELASPGGGGGIGPAAPLPPAPPRPGIDPASCAHRISPNGLADDSTSFSLRADPRSSPLLRLRLSRPRRPLRGAPAARALRTCWPLETRLLEPGAGRHADGVAASRGARSGGRQG